MRVIIDPIDGSLNAKRGIPSTRCRSPSPTARRWPTSRSGSSTTSGRARSGGRGGARAPGSTASALDPTLGERRGRDGRLEVLGIESADPRWVAASIDGARATAPTGCARSARSPPRCARSRPPASTGWSRCGAPAGVDAAAGQLIVREAGGLVSFPWCDRARWARRSTPSRARPWSPPARRRRSPAREDPGVIDWIIAERIATFVAGTGDARAARPPTWPRWPPSPRRAWSPTPASSPPGRCRPPRGSAAASGWPANIDSMRLLLDPVLKRAGDNLGPLQARRCEIGMGIVLSTEVGVVARATWRQRVLGQYELVLLDEAVEDRPAAPAVRAPQPRPGGAGVRGRRARSS